MSNKVGQVDSSGSAKVQNISEELEKTIADLKIKSDALEKKLTTKIDKFDKTLAGINNRVKKAEKNISFLTHSKTNKKQVSADLSKIDKTTAQLQTDLNSVANSNAQLVTIAEKLKERTNELESLKTAIKLLRADMTKTAGTFINKDDLDNSLKKQKRLFQLEIQDSYNKITKKIALLKFANQNDSKRTGVVEPNIN